MELTFDRLIEFMNFDKEMMEFVIQKHTTVELKALLKKEGVKRYSALNKSQLVEVVIYCIVNGTTDISSVVTPKKKANKTDKLEYSVTLEDLLFTKNKAPLLLDRTLSSISKENMVQIVNKIDSNINTSKMSKVDLLEIIKESLRKEV